MSPASGNFGVIFVRSQASPLGLASFQENWSRTSPSEAFAVDSLEGASSLIQNQWTGVIFTVLQSKSDLVQIAQFLAKHQAKFKTDKTLRMGIFSDPSYVKASDFLIKNGATEVLDFATSAKAISHKISVHLKLVKQASNKPRSTAIEFDMVVKAEKQDLGPNVVRFGVASAKPPQKTPPPPQEPVAGKRWKGGLESLQKQEALPSWNGQPVEIVDQVTKDSVLLDVPQREWKVGEPFILDVATENLDLSPILHMAGEVSELSAHELADRCLLKLKFDAQSAVEFEKLQEKMEALQEQILSFFKEVKG